MSDKRVDENDIANEFRELGKNLADVLRNAWDSPERKRLQSEVETGLKELGITLKKEVETFQESPTGQRIKSDLGDVQERIRSGEVQSKARSELYMALQKVNEELEKVAVRFSGKPGEASSGWGQEGAQQPYESVHEVHPDDVQTTSSESAHEEVNPDDVDAPTPPEA